MEQNRKFILVFLNLIFVTFASIAQQKANVNTDIDIVRVYEQTVEEGYPTLEIYQKLATTQYFRNNYKEAKKWFELWFEMEMPKDKSILLRYKQTLKALKLSFDNNKYLAVAANRN